MRYDFKVRVLTDMFVGGADNTEADLTPASIRGPLRFWFRAMMGRVLGNDLETIRELETTAFGLTDSSSPFLLRLANIPKTRLAGAKVKLEAGQAYLGVGALYKLEDKNAKRYIQQRGCIPNRLDDVVPTANQQFDVSFLFRRTDAPLYRVVLGSFWLLAHYGGIGARTRKGFGAFAVILDKPLGKKLSFTPDATPEAFLEQNESVVAEWFKQFVQREAPDKLTAATLDVGDPAFSRLVAGSRRVLTRPEWTVEQTGTVLDDLGRTLRGFRNGMLKTQAPWHITDDAMEFSETDDFQQIVKPYLDTVNDPHGNQLAAPEGAYAPDLNGDVLGLPTIYRDRQRRTASVQAVGPDKKFHRRASPFLFRPILLPENRIGVVVITLHSLFLPTDWQITLNGTRDQTVWKIVDVHAQTIARASAGLDNLLLQHYNRVQGVP